MTLDDLFRRFESLKAGRANFEEQWQQIAERVLPQMADFTSSRAPGERRTERMFDATASLAAVKAVAAIQSFTTPSNQRYQRLTTDDESLNRVQRVKAYFDEVTDILFRARYSTRAGFEAQNGESMLQFFVFGTGLLFIDEDIKRQTLSYKSIHLGQAMLAEGPSGMVDTVYRCWQMSLRNIEARWPGRLPDALRNRLAQAPDDTVEVAHATLPRDDYDPSQAGNKRFPIACVYWLPGQKHLLQESGYHSWPYAVARYMTTPGEVYGRSPAWLAMSNIRVLNTMKRTTLAAAQKVADPPLLAAEDGVLGAFSQAPGYLNMGGLDASGAQLVKPLISGGDVRLGLEMMDKEREIIAGAFLMDVFRALVENPQMTATQAMELLQERATVMAPIVGRIESEGLGPQTERELDLLARGNQLPPMPPELVEAQGEYRIEYTSPARKAMRSSEGIAITRTLESVIPLAQVKPELLDVFDLDEAARELGEINGMPAKLIRDAKAMQAIKADRANQQQAAALMDAAPVVSQTAANLAKLQAAGGLQPGFA